MKTKKRKKGTFLIVQGLLLIGAALCLTVYNIWDGVRAERASMKIVKELNKKMEYPDGNKDKDPESAMLYPNREMPTIEIDGYRYVGKVAIPSLDLELPVMEEWDYKRLKISPCRYSGSVYQDNMVLAAHNYARHFSHIKSLPEGSKVRFIDVEGNEYVYKVSWVEIVNPTEIDKMTEEQEGKPWDLTLFTCTTGGSTRYTMRCARVSSWPGQ